MTVLIVSSSFPKTLKLLSIGSFVKSLVLLLSYGIIVVHSYITSQPGTVPLNKQFQWLKQMTDDICSLKIGELSPNQVSQTREIMYEWSHNPKLNTVCEDGTDECAIAVESLLKRVVDEQKAITENEKKKKKRTESSYRDSFVSSTATATATATETTSSLRSYSSMSSSSTFSVYDVSSSSSSTTTTTTTPVVQVTVQDYNCVLESWARSNAGIVAADRCEQIIHAMLEYGPYPNLASFKACLMAWKQTMYTTTTTTSPTSTTTSPTTSPTTPTTTITKHPNNQHNQQHSEEPTPLLSNVAPLRAQRLLELMIRLHNENHNVGNVHVNILPDADCFDTVLQTWSRYNYKHNEKSTVSQQQQQQQQQPSASSSRTSPNKDNMKNNKNNNNNINNNDNTDDTIIIHAPRQAEQVLGLMDQLYRSTGNILLKPRRNSLNAVLATWARSPYPDAPDRAASILQYMEYRSQYYNDTSVTPDSASYNIVMNAFVHGSAVHSDPVWAANKAEQFVRRVVDIYKQSLIKDNTLPAIAGALHKKPTKLVPDTILFNTAMGLWGKAKTCKGYGSRSYKRARSILDLQISLYSEQQQQQQHQQYNNHKNNNNNSCKPDVVGFTSVIGCCATDHGGNTIEKEKAYHVAVTTYRQLEQMSVLEQQNRSPSRTSSTSTGSSSGSGSGSGSGSTNNNNNNNNHCVTQLTPNHITYGAMLKVCSKLLPIHSIERQQMVYEIFTKCKTNGYVCESVLTRLKEVASPMMPMSVPTTTTDATTAKSLYKELMEGYSRLDYPSSWSKNAIMYEKQQNHHHHSHNHHHHHHSHSSNNHNKSKQHQQQQQRRLKRKTAEV